MKTILTILISLFLIPSYAQNLVRVFDSPTAYTNYLMSKSMFADSKKYVVSAGGTSPTKDRLTGNALLVKTDKSGIVLFNKEYSFDYTGDYCYTNFTSVVEDGGSTGSVQYVAVGTGYNTIANENVLVLAMIDPSTGLVTNMHIRRTHDPKFTPVKILYSASTDQFICVYHVKSPQAGLTIEKILVEVLDANLNSIDRKMYTFNNSMPLALSTEILRPVDAVIYTNIITMQEEIAIIGTAHDLASINPVIGAPIINPAYNHPTPFFARLPLPPVGGPVSANLNMHIYPFLFGGSSIEGCVNTAFTRYDNGTSTGFYIGAMREAVLLGQTEPIVLDVNDNGILSTLYPFNSPPVPGGAHKSDLITSIHYNSINNSLTMTGGRYEGLLNLNTNLIDFNEFQRTPTEPVYAKSWILDFNTPSIKAWKYGSINNYDSTSWITGSVYDESLDMVYAFGDFNTTANGDARGFLFMDEVSHNYDCYKEDEDVSFNSEIFIDTILPFVSVDYTITLVDNGVIEADLNDKLDCSEESHLPQVEGFSALQGKTSMGSGITSITIFDITGKLMLNGEVAADVNNETVLRQNVAAHYARQLGKNQIYLVKYKYDGKDGYFKWIVIE